MDIAGLTGTTSTATTAPAGSGLAGINGEDFMKILIKQLQNQDPLTPMDNQQMVQQMATIRELEMNTQLSTKLGQLTDQQRFAGAASLMGKRVSGTVEDGNGNSYPISGVVKTVRFTEKGDILLDLDNGQSLPLAKLQTIGDAPVSVPQSGTIVPATNAKSLFSLNLT
jgi:flagellar basal-body rod modification protein FlgD